MYATLHRKLARLVHQLGGEDYAAVSARSPTASSGESDVGEEFLRISPTGEATVLPPARLSRTRPEPRHLETTRGLRVDSRDGGRLQRFTRRKHFTLTFQMLGALAWCSARRLAAVRCATAGEARELALLSSRLSAGAFALMVIAENPSAIVRTRHGVACALLGRARHSARGAASRSSPLGALLSRRLLRLLASPWRPRPRCVPPYSGLRAE